MNRPPDSRRVEALFAEAMDLEPPLRAEHVARTCGDDVALRDEVLSLLAASDRAGAVEALVSGWSRPFLAALEAGLEPGVRLAGYTIVRELGRGGMGVVYEARDARLERDVAIKLVGGVADPASADRLLAEARAASALDHTAICAIHHVGEDEAGRPFIVMPLYRGETLRHRLARGALPVGESVAIAMEVARGLGAAHAAGIVHRDIKPGNLMVLRDGGVRILDFGIAAARGDRSLQPAGTTAYTAPEQLRGGPVDARADLWSLGVVLYEMLTGRRPFGGVDDEATRGEVLNREIEPPSAFRPELPPRLDAVVRRLLARDPRDRYADAAELIVALDAVRWEAAGPHAARGALPVPLTGITGRDAELERIGALLRRVRLLTLTGPGGAGKTRLAVEAGHRLAHLFADGCRYVELAHVTEPDRVAGTVAHTLGLLDAPGTSPLEQVARALGGSAVLLVLDNFEQVAASAGVVRELLGACPGLRILVTSRLPLRIAGEQELPIAPLRVPDAASPRRPAALLAYPAVRLFVDRARAVHPDFRLTPANAAAVAELCIRLDGLPLAIELAAARTRLFTPHELLRRLDRHLDVLREERGDRPDRHRRLSEAIAWSHDLLDDAAQPVFRRLAVFRGGFTLEAAEAVCDVGPAAIDAVEALLDHNLLHRREAADGPRFAMLETIRAFALERLAASGERNDAERRHATYMVRLAEDIGPEIAGGEQVAALERLDAENDNLRVALAWCERTEPLLALRLGAELWRFWVARGLVHEGRAALECVLAIDLPGAPAALRARVLNGAATIAHGQGDNARATRWLEESLALCRAGDDEQGVAAALNNLSWVACETTRLDRATELASEALRLCRGLGDRRGEALALNNLGWVAQYRDDGAEARARHAESLEIRRAIGDRRGAAFALTNLAWAESTCGEPARAITLLDEADRILATVRDPILLGWAMAIRGIAERDRGDDARAATCFEQALDCWGDAGNRSGRATVYTELGAIQLRAGRHGEAMLLLGQAREDFRAIPCPWGETRVDALIARASAGPG